MSDVEKGRAEVRKEMSQRAEIVRGCVKSLNAAWKEIADAAYRRWDPRLTKAMALVGEVETEVRKELLALDPITLSAPGAQNLGAVTPPTAAGPSLPERCPLCGVPLYLARNPAADRPISEVHKIGGPVCESNQLAREAAKEA